MILEALQLTALDLAMGGVFALAIGLIAWIIVTSKPAPPRPRPARVEPVDFAGEIRVKDRTRRGPAAPLVHHYGKQRVGL